MSDNAELMMEILRAVEKRDEARFAQLCQPGAEFWWPPSLPYGAEPGRRQRPSTRPAGDVAVAGTTWTETWDPLQPTAADRRLDGRVVGAFDDKVVMLWHQRGVDRAGRRLDVEVLALYEISEHRLARAQMFYFDTARVAAFLADAAAS